MKKSFITVVPDTGKNNRDLLVKADANEDYVSRYATLKFEGGGITKSVSIEQDPNPYVYIDCGYIFSSANIEEPYESSSDGVVTYLSFNVKFANFILSSKNRFIIKNVSSLPVNLKNPVIGSIVFLDANDQYLDEVIFEGFITEVVPNSENEGTILSIIDITPAKINKIVEKINYLHDASTTGNIKMGIRIESTGGTGDDLGIVINVI